MKIKFLSVIASFFIVSLVITSCLDNDDNIEYSPDATIRAFVLDTIGYGVTYPFTIDQLKGEIYNEDSLPVRADTIINRILIKTITTSSGIVTVKDQNGNDSILSLSDSIDLSKTINKGAPLVLKVWAPDMQQTKEYKLWVNIHKHDPDSVSWKYMNTNPSILNNESLKSVILKGKIITYSGSTSLKVHTAPLNNPTAWSTSAMGSDWPSGQPLTSVINFKETLYATSGDNHAFKSSDGINWVAASFPAANGDGSVVDLFLAAYDNKILYSRIAGEARTFYSTGSDTETGNKISVDSDDLDKFPVKNISYTLHKTSSGMRGVMLVGEPKEPTTIEGSNSTKINTTETWAYMEGASGWINLPAGSINSYCPELKNPSILYYNDLFYLFGEGFNGFYRSNSGRDWKLATKFNFPQIDWSKSGANHTIATPEFRGRKNYAMVSDTLTHNLIFMFSGGEASFTEKVTVAESTKETTDVTRTYNYSSEVWSGRLNQLWFDLANSGK